MRYFNRIAVFVVIILIGIGFIVATWVHFSNFSPALPVAIGLLALAYIPVAIFGFRLRHPILRAVAIPAAIAFGFISFSLMAAIGSWVLTGFARFFQIAIEPRTIALSLFGLGLLAVIIGLINAAWIRITHYTVALADLPPEWMGKTAALVSDVHLGNIRSAAFAEKIVARLKALKPVAVFISGDMFDGAKVDLVACARPWGEIHAPMGTFFVSGNHDEFSDVSEILSVMRAVGVQVVDDQKVIVGGLQIIGVHDGAARDPEGFRAILQAAEIVPDRPSILLNHQPANLPVAEAAGISLQLSGHTHRGQFWPWTLLVSRVFGKFAYGLNRLNTMQVITSSGVGTWGPPIRVGSRSEIVLIHFVAA